MPPASHGPPAFVHRHPGLAQHVLAGIERGDRHLGMRVGQGADAHRIDGLVRDDLGPVAMHAFRDVQFLRRLLARRCRLRLATPAISTLFASCVRRPGMCLDRVLAPAPDDTDSECVCCHGWSLLVRATFGMAREAYSTLVTRSLDRFTALYQWPEAAPRHVVYNSS